MEYYVELGLLIHFLTQATPKDFDALSQEYLGTRKQIDDLIEDEGLEDKIENYIKSSDVRLPEFYYEST